MSLKGIVQLLECYGILLIDFINTTNSTINLFYKKPNQLWYKLSNTDFTSRLTCSPMSHVTTIIVFSYLCDDTVILGSTGSETFKRAMTINNKNYFVGVG